MNNFDTSAWKGFELQDLFDSINGNVDIKKEDINGKGAIVVTAGTANNGILGKTDIEASIVPSNTITVDMFGNCTYRDSSYKMVTHARVFALIPKYAMFNEQIGLFIVTVLEKMIQQYSFDNMCSWNKIKAQKISLPSTEINEPDWNYMQERIAELEQERIAELEHYLIATGLNDYELTEEDKQILATKLTDGGGASQSSESGGGCWKEARKFKLVDIANVSYGTKFDKNKMSHACPEINFVSRTAIHNGVSDCVDECGIKPFATGTITLALGGSIGSCFIQEKPYYTGQNVGVIELPTYVTDKAKVYFVGALQKECKAQFTAFANEINRYLKTTLSVLLPTTSNGQPDWDFMDKYIHAIEKAVIADVVKYKDETIANTKAIVQQPSL